MFEKGTVISPNGNIERRLTPGTVLGIATSIDSDAIKKVNAKAIISSTDANNDGELDIRDLVRAKKITANSSGQVKAINETATDQVKDALLSDRNKYYRAMAKSINKLKKGNDLSEEEKRSLISLSLEASESTQLNEDEKTYYRSVHDYVSGLSKAYDDFKSAEKNLKEAKEDPRNNFVAHISDYITEGKLADSWYDIEEEDYVNAARIYFAYKGISNEKQIKAELKKVKRNIATIKTRFKNGEISRKERDELLKKYKQEKEALGYLLSGKGGNIGEQGELMLQSIPINILNAVNKTGDAIVNTAASLFGKNDVVNTRSLTEDVAQKVNTKIAQNANTYGDKFNISGNIVNAISSTLPTAIIAIMCPPAAAESALVSGGIATFTTGEKVAASVSAMIKNPAFWTSYVMTFGDDYYDFVEKGADARLAFIGASISTPINSAIEISGGVETLPGELRKFAGKNETLLKWLTSSLEEGGEEILQGTVSDIMGRIVSSDFEFSQERFNEFAKNNLYEGLMGFIGGAFLSGGQITFENIVNASTKSQYKDLGKYVKTILKEETLDYIIEYAKSSDNETIRSLVATENDINKLSDTSLGMIYSYMCRDINTAINLQKNIEDATNGLKAMVNQLGNDSPMLEGVVIPQYSKTVKKLGGDDADIIIGISDATGITENVIKEKKPLDQSDTHTNTLQSNANGDTINNNPNKYNAEERKAAILRYKSGEAYIINAKLRESEQLTEVEQEFVDTLDEALLQLPKHEGTVYRNVTFDDFGGQQEFDDFLNQYIVDKLIIYEQFLSCSKEPGGYPVEGEYKISFVIDSKNARDVDGYGNNMESEVVFSLKSAFIVKNVEINGKHPTIYLQEVLLNGYESNEEQSDAVRNLQKLHFEDNNLQSVSEGNTVGNTFGQVRPQSPSPKRSGNTVRAGGGQETVLSAERREQANNQITQKYEDSEATSNGDIISNNDIKGGDENVIPNQGAIGENSRGFQDRQSDSGADSQDERAWRENQSDFIRRAESNKEETGKRNRILLRNGNAILSYKERASDNSSGDIAVKMLESAGVDAVYCYGDIETNQNGVTVRHSEAVTTPDGKVFVSSNATLPSEHIAYHENVHVNDNLGTDAYAEYESLICGNLLYNSKTFEDICEQINDNHYGGKYDIESPEHGRVFIQEIAAYVNEFVMTEPEFAERTFGGMFNDWNAVVEAVKKFNTDTKADFSEAAFFMAEAGKRDNINLGGIDTDKARHLNREEQERITEIGERLGRKVIYENFYSMDKFKGKKKIPDGYIDGSGDIHINFYAKRPVEFIFKHEITHYLKRSLSSYHDFMNMVLESKAFKNWLNNRGYASIDELKAEITDTYSEVKGFKEENCYDEILADFCAGYLFGGEKAVSQELIDALEPKKKRTFLDVIKNIIAYFKEKFSKDTQLKAEIAAIENAFIKVYNKAVNEQTKTKGESGEQYSIGVLENGNTFVINDRNVITATDVSGMRKQITEFFNELLDKKGSIDIPTIDGDILTITKNETANKSRDNFKSVNGKPTRMSNKEFAVKLRAESHIDELAEASREIANSSDKKAHSFAKDGFTYRTAYFEDYDGRYYKITLSVGNGGNIATIYNIGNIKEDQLPSAKLIAVVGSKPLGKRSSTDSISNSSENVNENYSIPVLERSGRTTENSEFTEQINELNGKLQRGEISQAEFIESVKNTFGETTTPKRQKVSNPIEIANTTEEDADTTPQLKRKQGESNGDKTSNTYESLLESDIFDDKFKEEVKTDSFIEKYKSVTNKETLKKAAKELDEGGKDRVAKWWSTDAEHASLIDTAMGFILMDRYQRIGDYQDLSDSQKVKAVSSVYNYATAVAKSRLDYDYETLSAMVGYRVNGTPILTEKDYKELNKKARQILAERYFMSKGELSLKGNTDKLAHYLIKSAKE